MSKAIDRQARQVQQVLIPEAISAIPGFALKSEYRPAQQVGGDFFQILPTPDGGVLAIVGDVSKQWLQRGCFADAAVAGADSYCAGTRTSAICPV